MTGPSASSRCLAIKTPLMQKMYQLACNLNIKGVEATAGKDPSSRQTSPAISTKKQASEANVSASPA